jgi:hypothetical protein
MEKLREKYILLVRNKKTTFKVIVIPFPLQPPGLGLEGECLRGRPVLQVPAQHVHVGPRGNSFLCISREGR